MTQEERLIAVIRAQGKLISNYQLLVAKNPIVSMTATDEDSKNIGRLRQEIEELQAMPVDESILTRIKSALMTDEEIKKHAMVWNNYQEYIIGAEEQRDRIQKVIRGVS